MRANIRLGSLRQKAEERLTIPVMILIIVVWVVVLTGSMILIRRSLESAEKNSADLIMDEVLAETEPTGIVEDETTSDQDSQMQSQEDTINE